MKKLFLIVAFCLSFCLTLAQTHRFIYEFKFKTNPNLEDYKKENMTLDVNPDEVKFYNYHYVTIDSTNITKGQNSQLWDTTTPVVTRIKNEDKYNNYLLINDLFVFESEAKFDWKLHTETKKFGNYTLQKATTTFSGRNWIAWFCKEINISEGPYKFHGLPGLIFEIHDDKNNFQFALVKSFKLQSTYKTPFLDKFYGQKPIKTSLQNINKMLLDYYNDPHHETKEQFSKNTNSKTIFSINGVDIKDASQFKDLTLSTQKYIRDHYNPIELDIAVVYPKKQ